MRRFRTTTIKCPDCKKKRVYPESRIERFGLPTNCHHCNGPLRLLGRPIANPTGPSRLTTSNHMEKREENGMTAPSQLMLCYATPAPDMTNPLNRPIRLRELVAMSREQIEERDRQRGAVRKPGSQRRAHRQAMKAKMSLMHTTKATNATDNVNIDHSLVNAAIKEAK